MVNVTCVKNPPTIKDFEGWEKPKKILVILAHPDDPEFFCGATIAKWCSAGHEVRYCLLTTGQKGSQDIKMSPAELSEIRKNEQEKAAQTLGVSGVEFLDYIDGEIFPDLEMRKKIVRVIRRFSPNIVVSCDPQNLFPSDSRINHPDHRAAGQAVVDAVFPAAGSPVFFPELIQIENLAPVNIDELWLSVTSQPNLVLDMTAYFDKKISAVLCHKSQIPHDEAIFINMMKSRFEINIDNQATYYPEKFKRIKLK